jgi:hypothetical protein
MFSTFGVTEEDEDTLVALTAALLALRAQRSSSSLADGADLALRADEAVEFIITRDIDDILTARKSLLIAKDENVDEEMPSSSTSNVISIEELCVARSVDALAPQVEEGSSLAGYLVPAAIGLAGAYAFFVARGARASINVARQLPQAALLSAVKYFKELNDAVSMQASQQQQQQPQQLADAFMPNDAPHDPDATPMSIVLMERSVIPDLLAVEAAVSVGNALVSVETLARAASVGSSLIEMIDGYTDELDSSDSLPLEIGAARTLSTLTGTATSVETIPLHEASVIANVNVEQVMPTHVPLDALILSRASGSQSAIAGVRVETEGSRASLTWVPSRLRDSVVSLDNETVGRLLLIGTEEMPRMARIRGLDRNIGLEASVVNYVHGLARPIEAAHAIDVHDRVSVESLVNSARSLARARPPVSGTSTSPSSLELYELLSLLLPGETSFELDSSNIIDILSREALFRDLDTIGSPADDFQSHVVQSSGSRQPLYEARVMRLDERALSTIVEGMDQATHVSLIVFDARMTSFTFRDVSMRNFDRRIDVEIVFDSSDRVGRVVGWSGTAAMHDPDAPFVHRRLIRLTIPVPSSRFLSLDGHLMALGRSLSVLGDLVESGPTALPNAHALDNVTATLRQEDIPTYGSLLASSFRARLELAREQRPSIARQRRLAAPRLLQPEEISSIVRMHQVSQASTIESTMEREGVLTTRTSSTRRALSTSILFNRAHLISLLNAATLDSNLDTRASGFRDLLLNVATRVAITLPARKRAEMLHMIRLIASEQMSTSDIQRVVSRVEAMLKNK